MKDYNGLTNKLNVPVTQPISANQVKNNQGGYVYSITPFDQLLRFLIIGSDRGSYYASARDLTTLNVEALQTCITDDYVRTVDMIVDVSVNARAPSNDTALYALAVVASADNKDARKYALSKLNAVARIGTHLFTFVHYANNLRGWGELLKNAVSNWYTSKDNNDLSFQVIKYGSRNGWSHRDVLRLAHTKTTDTVKNSVFRYVVKGTVDEHVPRFIEGTVKIKAATTVAEVLQLLKEYKLPREVIPTQYLNDTKVWDMLLSNGMPYTAMLRNLGKMSSLGMTGSNIHNATQTIISTLTNQQAITASKIHPLALLTGLYVYSAGRGVKGSLEWAVNQSIVDALNTAFYASFGNVQSTGKKILIALDISGSMCWEDINGIPGLTPRVVSAAMALVTLNVEKKVDIVGFSTKLIPLAITPTMRLDAVCKYMDNLNFGGTNCTLPMDHAIANNLDYDAFLVYTDSETGIGRRHPSVALKEVRAKFNSNAKLAVIGLVANNFSIADPTDPGMLDFVGFDAALPQVLSEFMKM